MQVLPGQHLLPFVPQVEQRMLVEVAVEVAVEVDVEEQKVFAWPHLPPRQQGLPESPQVTQTPALDEDVSQTDVVSRHFVLGEVLVLPQQGWFTPPHAWHFDEIHCRLAPVHLLSAQQGPSKPPQMAQVPALVELLPAQTRSAVAHCFPLGVAEVRQHGWSSWPQIHWPSAHMP